MISQQKDTKITFSVDATSQHQLITHNYYLIHKSLLTSIHLSTFLRPQLQCPYNFVFFEIFKSIAVLWLVTDDIKLNLSCGLSISIQKYHHQHNHHHYHSFVHCFHHYLPQCYRLRLIWWQISNHRTILPVLLTYQ